MDIIFPKDVVVYIYEIVHKSYTCEMNKEYHKYISILTPFEMPRDYLMVAIPYNFTWFFNFRHTRICGAYTDGKDKTGQRFNLPSKYFYSSGMLHQYAYKK